MNDQQRKELLAGYTTFTTARDLGAGTDTAPGIDAQLTPTGSTSLIPWPTPTVDSTIVAGC